MVKAKAADVEARVVEMAPLLLSTATVARLLEVSRATLLRMVSAKEFPPPIHVGVGGRRRHPRWRRRDVEAWVEQQGLDTQHPRR